MRSKQQGFTLIELIVVIIILGTLAAVALPRFLDLQIQARQAKLQGAVGAVRAASALFHAQCLAALGSPTPPASCNTLSMEGQNVTGINQYPTANAAGITFAAGLQTGTAAGPGVDYIISGGGAGVGDTLTIAVSTPTAGTCQFTYQAAGPGGGNSTSAPIVTITTANSTCN